MDSILTSIKEMVGIEEEVTRFDPDLIVHINSVFADLHQLGVGPKEGFAIEDDIPVWTDFISDIVTMNNVKTYMYLRVKLLFDPPVNSAVINSLQQAADKYEWRLNVAAETPDS